MLGQFLRLSSTWRISNNVGCRLSTALAPIRWLSKARQLQLLAQLGLAAPRTWVVNASSKLEAAAQQLQFPLIVKPNVGGSGARMRRFDSQAELHEATARQELEDLFE